VLINGIRQTQCVGATLNHQSKRANPTGYWHLASAFRQRQPGVKALKKANKTLLNLQKEVYLTLYRLDICGEVLIYCF
jgi:hypothetical protein